MIKFSLPTSERLEAFLLEPREIMSVPLTHYILNPLNGIHMDYIPEELRIYFIESEHVSGKVFPVGHFLIALPTTQGKIDVEKFGYIRACRIQGWDT